MSFYTELEQERRTLLRLYMVNLAKRKTSIEEAFLLICKDFSINELIYLLKSSLDGLNNPTTDRGVQVSKLIKDYTIDLLEYAESKKSLY